ncbi:MAG TPA: secretin N-terminal domain-containing protein [Candidatus Acidoferrum sp.]|nr:secretin N-terminal domain-containing protein [Candidatus Acidoferrum sp.]
MNDWLRVTPDRGPCAPAPGRRLIHGLLILLGTLAFGVLQAPGQLLVLNQIPINPTNVAVGNLLTLQITYTNVIVIPPDTVVFQPLTNAPAGAVIDSSGFFQWQPTSNQVTSASGTNITVTAFLASQPLNVASITFRVIVTNNIVVPGAPLLSPIPPQTLAAGVPFEISSIYATNNDGTANPLTFNLATSPATDATISNGTNSVVVTSTGTNGLWQGVLDWTSPQPGLYTMYVSALEAATGSQSVTQSFTVNVLLSNNCEQYLEVQQAVEAGGTVVLTNCPTLVVSNTFVVSNAVTILAETNVTIAGNNLQRLFSVLSGGTLTLSNLNLFLGRSMNGGGVFVEKGGSLIAYNCTFEGNTAAGANGLSGAPGVSKDQNYGTGGGAGTFGWPAVGGAIFSRGNVEIYSCEFLTNSAAGGSGGSGGNGADGTYQGGNGGAGASGNVGYGGAIFSSGTLVVTNTSFIGNTAVGGNGGAGGTNGSGVFNGYPGTGGTGANAAGGAIFTGPSAVIDGCSFSGNSAQAGSSADGGTAGGGYGVNGAAGGTGFGGAVCFMGGGVLMESQFATNSAIGGNGGNGGNGNYGGGNGGDAGSGIGGCVYNFGKVTMASNSFTACLSIPGTNGAGGGGILSGRPGLINQILTNRFTNGFGGLPNGINAFGAVGPAVVAPPVMIDPSDAQAAGGTSVPVAADSGPAVSADAAAPKALAAPVTPAANPGAAGSNSPAIPSGAPAGLPSNRPSLPGGGANPPAPAAPADPSKAPSAKAPGEEPLPEGMIDFRGADLNQVLDIYSMLVNRTLLRPATLPTPTIVLKTQGQLTMKEGIQALEAVLALNGITMVNVGDKFVKVMPEAQSGSAAAPFSTNGPAAIPELGQYVTHIVQLKYAKPSELVPVLTPFVKIPNAILPLDPNQILILRDYAENVKRMLEMIAKIDVAVPSEFVQEVIPIKYGKASDIAGALNSLSAGGGGGASIGGGTTGGGRTTSSRGGMGRTGTMGGTMGGYGGAGSPFGGSPFGQPGMNPQGTTQQAGTGNNFTQRLQNIINRASNATGEIQVIGQTKIISDERTNSLLIFASRDDMKVIKDIISKLDVVLAQVLIESAVISVTLSDSRDLGFSYLQHPQNIGSWTGVGALNNKTFQSPQNYILNANGVTNGSSGVIPGGFSYLMSFGQDLDVAVAAAASDTRAKILQRPRIQTSHNEPASIFVGESRPYPTSSYYGGGAYGGYSSIQQLEIGVSLDVTPLINPDGLVVMDIHQKIDSFEGNVTIQNVGDVPITSEKEAQAKVSVRDHDTIILGGLIETDKNKNKSGVPFLMDIPMLGYLFRSSHVDETRDELIVLIRPTVLPTPEIAALTATAEKNKMPGVLATEKELRSEDAERLKQAVHGEPTPFQMVNPH